MRQEEMAQDMMLLWLLQTFRRSNGTKFIFGISIMLEVRIRVLAFDRLNPDISIEHVMTLGL